MPRVMLDLPHDGETLDEAIADIERRYAVTITVVNERGPNGVPEVAVDAEDVDRVINAARGGFGLDDEEIDELGLTADST